MPVPLLIASYAEPADFLAAFGHEISKRGLLIRHARVENIQAMEECRVRLVVGDIPPMEISARIAAVVPGIGVAVIFADVPQQLVDLERQLRSYLDSATSRSLDGLVVPTTSKVLNTAETSMHSSASEASVPAPGSAASLGSSMSSPASPVPDHVVASNKAKQATDKEAPRGTLSEQIKALTVAQRMSLALSGSREERMALLRDNVKTIHIFVLKNPRIGLDEVQYAAKMTTLSVDALKMIAEHREWGVNAVVCTALVRNPKTPLPIALRLLDRIPMSELRTLAKGGARDQIVLAARKRVVG